MLRRIIISTALLLALPPASLLLQATAGCSQAATPAKAPPFPSATNGRWLASSLERFDAPRVLSTRGDRLVVTALWATWCEPCIAEMPELEAFQKAHPEVVVLGLATDPPSAAPAIQAVLDRVRPTYSQALLDGGEGKFLNHLGLEWDGILPKTLVIGDASPKAAAGPVRLSLASPVTRSSLEAALAPYLPR